VAGQLVGPRRFGAAARAGHDRGVDGRLGGLADQVRVAEVGPAVAVARPPGEEGPAERVAGADGVHDRSGGHLDLDLLPGGERAHGVRAVGDQDAGGTGAEQSGDGGVGVLARVQVGEVLGAHLDDVGPAQDPAEPVQVGLPGGDRAGAAVRVEHDRDIGRGMDGQAFDAGPDRLHDQAEGADVEGRRAGREHRLGRADGGGRGLGQVEVVGGHAGRVHVDQGQRGGLARRVGDGDPDAVALQVGAHQLAEAVAGQAAEEGCRLAEPGDGAGYVERAAAHPRVHAPGLVDDQVDQGLTRNNDHWLPHRERSWVSIVWLAG